MQSDKQKTQDTIGLVIFGVIALCIIVLFSMCAFGGKDDDSIGESDAWVCAQDVVKKNLKSPSSAKFCLMSEATIHYNGEDGGGSRYTVSGYVDAQNSFGATIRKNFTVNLTVTKDGYKRATCTFY
jgi:hypothetical protein